MSLTKVFYKLSTYATGLGHRIHLHFITQISHDTSLTFSSTLPLSIVTPSSISTSDIQFITRSLTQCVPRRDISRTEKLPTGGNRGGISGPVTLWTLQLVFPPVRDAEKCAGARRQTGKVAGHTTVPNHISSFQRKWLRKIPCAQLNTASRRHEREWRYSSTHS